MILLDIPYAVCKWTRLAFARIASKAIGAFALTEAVAGRDAAAIRHGATRPDGGRRIFASRHFITSGRTVQDRLGSVVDKVKHKLGHPIRAIRGRIIVTHLSALKDPGRRLGVAALCIGGGEATAVAIERI
jgi:hypothetical protein